MSKLRLHLADPQLARPLHPPMPLGRHLVETGAIRNKDLVHALDLQQHVDAPLGEILIAEGLASSRDVLECLAAQHNTQLVDLRDDPPQPGLDLHLPPKLCLEYRAVAWMDMGGVLLVATSRPELFDKLRQALGEHAPTILPIVASEQQIQDAITNTYGLELAHKAATRVPAIFSCRTWDVTSRIRTLWALAIMSFILACVIIAPLWSFTVAALFAFITLLMTSTLKAAALWSQITHKVPDAPVPFTANHSLNFRLPRVSIMVPLLKEREIASALIARLTKLTYPKALLDVVLVLEESDAITRTTLARTALPSWVSVITVPAANSLTTKPRALNYALDFCKGSIIGIWDAEDAPEPDQLERVVDRFRKAPENVACLQGILDYYNPRANWLSRCFTIEYATWWRVLLPGVARMGLVIPLGGTTLFFRRNILEKLSGWDAHNVTEDADLGVRLARAGYVTELLPTVTYEEANCRLWPWIRQRSRWLKGFLITWCVHMRDPRQLLRDLGWCRFIGIQTMLLATVAQFFCAPLLWSFWIAMFGLPHPVPQTLGNVAMWSMVSVFILSYTLNLGMSLMAVSGKEHRHLMWWVFTTPFYYPLGALAAFKGLQEFVASPFFWDKTEHGVTSATEYPQNLIVEGPQIAPVSPRMSELETPGIEVCDSLPHLEQRSPVKQQFPQGAVGAK
ncbi:glycosyltransferase [Sulfitobacter sp. F26204]|uniref:glycosyltransferase family 2 protein n=1 Tax=Sulfitobacter sp. F26204 TaxID=2996014 RepID=UPI00225E41D8|nr:glycosyltransferase family 2 protein [Sulfitobacter sp. F26204]MCX7559324.1 glycosyltransferase [Sulfitobacter sp. F26204]